MIGALKDKVFDAQNKWLSEMEKSKDGSTNINLTTDILKIFQRFLAHIVFGDEELNT